MIRSIIMIVLLALLAFGAAEWLRRQSLFYPDRFPAGDWDTTELPIQPEDVSFASADGTSLHGWLFESSLRDAPVLVYFHGNGGNLTYRAEPAVALTQAGFHVFIFDYRGYGRSEGAPTERSLYEDSLAAWDVMRKRFEGPMIAYGESLGGPYSAYVAATRGDACAVIAASTFPSIASVAREVYRPIPVHWLLRPGLETAKHLNSAKVPVLVMHSSTDQVIPFSLGKELFESIRGPKQLHNAERADHSAIYWADPTRYVTAIRNFADQYCGGATQE